MQKVFGIWNTKYHLPKKYLEKYLNVFEYLTDYLVTSAGELTFTLSRLYWVSQLVWYGRWDTSVAGLTQ